MPVSEPVFIVATPRSGTTFLHHLLALDEENFSHFRLYHTVFPSVSAQRAISLLGALDRVGGHGFSRALSALNRRLFPAWRGIHEVSLDGEEEDESLFVLSWLSPALYLLSPFVKSAPEFSDIDSLDERVRSRLARDYRSTVQRHLFHDGLSAAGKARKMLVKNVLMPSRMTVTETAFPDARYIRVVRDPVRAIPSAMSLFFAAWRAHSPDIDSDSEESRALGKMFLDHYRRLDDFAAAHPERVLTVRFEDLVSAPESSLEKIYAFLGLTWGPEAQRRVSSALASREKFKSQHEYRLEDFGLSEEDVERALGEVVPALGYGGAPRSAPLQISQVEGEEHPAPRAAG